jgi:MarR family transcriptional regulator, lower aerobic nicotinate degradation pathway regulator
MTRTSTRKISASHPRAPLDALPGHCIRRLQQIAVAIFIQESAASGATPVQFAVLQALADQPGIDQRSLARVVSLDTSTIGGVVDRLEARGLLTRSHSPEDRRVRLLHLTPEGESLLSDLIPSMQRTQERILEPLSVAERRDFMRMVQQLIGHHGELGRSNEPGKAA